jgi:hypothetical protein
VLHSNRTHLIFWAPPTLPFDAGYVQLVETYQQNVALDSHMTTNVFGITGEYGDNSGPAAYDSTYAGAIIDTDPLPVNGCALAPPPPLNTGPILPNGAGWPVCLNDTQIQAEVEHVVTANNLPRTSTDIYFVITPDGFGTCTPDKAGSDRGPDSCSVSGSGLSQSNPYDSFCGYHSATGSGVLYGVVPYNAVPNHCQSNNPRPNGNTADPSISTLSHEHSEVITDPLGDAWIDLSGNEVGDLCAQDFGPALGGSVAAGTAWDNVIHGGHYYIQEEWSDVDGSTEATACRPHAAPDQISAKIPHTVQGDRKIKFSTTASHPHGTITRYIWNFGDETAGRHSRTTHIYRKTGTFVVIAIGVDSAANWAIASGLVRVVQPSPPVAKIAGPGHATNASRQRFKLSSNAAVATFECRVDDGAFKPCRASFNAHVGPGAHRLSVRATDTFSQVSRRAASYAFTVA